MSSTNGATTPAASSGAKRRPRRVRLKDISDKADLSVSTVSMALADHPTISRKTKNRVVEICRELGYARSGPAGHLASLVPVEPLKDKLISFVMVGSRFDDPSYAPILHHLAQQTQQRQAQLRILPAPDVDVQAAHEMILDQARHSDAVILIGHVPAALLEKLHEIRIAQVIMGLTPCPVHQPLPAGLTIVAPDELAMGRLAAASLLERGHRRIAFVCEMIHPGLSHHQWLQGYRLAHLELGAAMDEKLICIPGHHGADVGKIVAKLAAMAQPPTALIVPDVPMARWFMDLWRAAGHKLPDDAIVAGGDPQRAIAFGMTHVGRIYCESPRLVSATLDALAAKLQGRDLARQSILLHPTCDNL